MESIETWIRSVLADPRARSLAIVVGSLVAAKLLQLLLTRVVLRYTARTRSRIDDAIVRRLETPLFVTLLAVGLEAALEPLEPSARLQYWTAGLLRTVLVLLWAVALIRIVGIALDVGSRRTDRPRWLEVRTIPLLDNLAKLLIVGGALYALLVVWRLDVKPWLASAGIVGIAVGFAAKDTLANLFAGLFILADAPYKIGDWIVLDTGERGMVTAVGLRSTRLLTRDDVEVTLPNAVIANAKIVNESGGPWERARVSITVGVAYGSDVDRVRAALVETAQASEFVAGEPEPRVRFSEFGDSALVFRLLCWIDRPVLRGQAIDDLHTRIYRRFLADGIEIPFPQRVVHLPDRD